MKKFIDCIIFVIPFLNLHSQLPGTLDQQFGNKGWSITEIPNGASLINDMAVQEDGKIVTAAYFQESGREEDILVMRYNEDGTLDATFGDGGKWIHDFSDGSDVATCLAVQKDGKIVVGGWMHTGTEFDFFVTRLNSDGSPDSGFANNGIGTYDLAVTDRAFSLIILQDGSILVSGWSYSGANYDFGMIKLLPNGSKDTGFGNNGMTITDFGGNDYANDMAIQKNGQIVLVGDASIGDRSFYALSVYNANGKIDENFGLDGRLVVDVLGISDVAYTVACTQDNKIILAGQSNSNSISDMTMLAFNADGSKYTEFGTDGVVVNNLTSGGDYCFDMLIQKDGKILLAGFVAGNGSIADFALLRYNADGSLDPTFANDGVAINDFNKSTDEAYGVSLQKDGKILVAGVSKNASTYKAAIARFHNTNSLSTKINDKSMSFASIFPSPITNESKLHFQLIHAGNYTAKLYNNLGQCLFTFFQNQYFEQGRHTTPLKDIGNLAPGAYTLIINNDKSYQSLPIVK